MDPNGPPLVISVRKRIPPHSWLGPLGRPSWHNLTLTITPSATLTFVRSEAPSRFSRALHLFTSILIPGTARPATHSEQVAHLRDNLFVLIAVPTGTFDTRPRQVLHMCQAHSSADLHRIVNFANAASLRLIPTHHPPYAGPLLAVWGHTSRLTLETAVDAAASTGLPHSKKHFLQLLASTPNLTPTSQITPSQFVDAAMHAAVTALAESVTLLQSETPIDASSLAQLLRISDDHSLKMLSDIGLSTCDPPTLIYLLFHPQNSVVDPEKATDPHDMTRPLGDYLISSSHNTYLTGDQLQSTSSSIMYRVALEKGCRCVEIDAWNGDDGSPVVTHGRTMTSDVPLERVLQVISDNAFAHGNDAPVIISLENHLDVDQQRVAADQFARVFGDRLCRVGDFDVNAPLPSPHELRGRVVLKTKTLRSILQDGPDCSPRVSDAGSATGKDSFDSEETEDDTSSSGDMKPDRKSNALTPSRRKKQVKIASELDKQVLIANGNRKLLLSYWKRGISGVRIFSKTSCISLDEKRMHEAYEKMSVDVIREYNTHALTRVYPKGTRIGSSNYTPTMAHSLGCQIVALNWQRHDAPLAVNEARFLANGGCGYVLASSVRQSSPPQELQIRVISAFLLSFASQETNRTGSKLKMAAVDDPYCSIKLYDDTYDDDDDYSCFKFETETVRNNAFVPVWNQTARMKVRNVNLAVVNIKVYDRDRTSGDDLIGYCAVPTALLREGLRSFCLKSKRGDELKLPGTDLQPAVLCDVRWV